MQNISDAFISEMLQKSRAYTTVILKKGPNDDLPVLAGLFVYDIHPVRSFPGYNLPA